MHKIRICTSLFMYDLNGCTTHVDIFTESEFILAHVRD